MFIGHYGVALAAKRVRSRGPPESPSSSPVRLPLDVVFVACSSLGGVEEASRLAGLW